MTDLRKCRQTELPPVGGGARVHGLQLLVDADELGITDAQVEGAAVTAGLL
jgi:hypothetical protein